MARRKKPTRIVKGFVSNLAIFTLSASAVHAADLPTSQPAQPPAPAAVPEVAPHWYVRLGALGLIDQTTSNLYAQSIAGVVVPGIGFVPIAGAGPQLLLAGRSASYSSFVTASVQAGYFFTPNWSLEIAGGIPVWVKVKITGFSPTPPYSGTVLSTILPAAVPITAVYHFTQFGALQPYLGVGVEPSFLFSIQEGFNTGGWFAPAAGLVLQAGTDYMLNQNWGVFFDVKKSFTESTGKSNGINLGPPIGTIPADATIKTSVQPWLLSAGLTYRF